MRTLSILIPVFNEESYVERCVKQVCAIFVTNWSTEIILVDDGSTDATPQKLTLIQKHHPHVRVIMHEKNKGKGAALKTAMTHATGDILIVQDADLEYDPADYMTILEKYTDPHVHVVYGSRNLGKPLYNSHSAHALFFWGGVILTHITNTCLHTKLTDQATCYKSWRHTLTPGLMQSMYHDGFQAEIEMTAYFARHTRIVEVPIHYYPRALHHGKKIGFRDFLSSLFVLLQLRRSAV